MIQKIKKFYFKHYLKIVAIILAYAFWSIADSKYNAQQSRTFSVDIVLENLDVLRNNNLILENQVEIEQNNAQVLIKMAKKDMEEFAAVSKEMKAVLDLRPVVTSYEFAEGENIPVYLDIVMPETFKDAKKNIQNNSDLVANVRFGRYVEGFIADIELEKPIVAKEGYETVEETIEPKTVTIDGPETYISKIDRVTVEVKNQEISSDSIEYPKIEVYDENNNKITSHLSVYPDTATVNISVYKSYKLNISDPTYSGALAPGYAIKSVSFEPKSIDVLGKEKDLGSLKAIDLDTIDVSGKSETFTKVFKIADYIEDKNLQLKYNSSKEVKVTIEIEEIVSKEIVLQQSQLKINSEDSTYPRRITDENVKFTISGIKSLVEAIDISKINASLDISDLEPGIHSVPLKVEFPQGINIAGEPPTVNVEILSLETTPPPSASAENNQP